MRILGARGNHSDTELSKGMEMFVDQIFWSSVIITVFVIISLLLKLYVYESMAKWLHLRRIAIAVAVFDILSLLVLSSSLGIIHYMLERDLTFFESLAKLKEFIFNSTILFFLIVIIIASYVFQLIYTLVQQTGFGVLWKLMAGFYQKPREENRIFMFLDLQSSTSAAEKLGHKRYSDFIQDCFRLITRPLLTARGRVYQYAGDEVIITWNADKGKNFLRTMDFYFMYVAELEMNRLYFEKKYDIYPVFTASINVGKVMAAEVGEIKHELAYHGDVINTAARIQKKCRKYVKQLLATEQFISQNTRYTSLYYSTRFVDEVKFRGKNRRVRLYEIY